MDCVSIPICVFFKKPGEADEDQLSAPSRFSKLDRLLSRDLVIDLLLLPRTEPVQIFFLLLIGGVRVCLLGCFNFKRTLDI